MQGLFAVALDSRFHFGQPFCGSVYTPERWVKMCRPILVASLAGASQRSGSPGGVVSNGASGQYADALGLWA
jgi:hypothetical protein